MSCGFQAEDICIEARVFVLVILFGLPTATILFLFVWYAIFGPDDE